MYDGQMAQADARRWLLMAIVALGAAYAASMVWLSSLEGWSTSSPGQSHVSTASTIDVPSGMTQTLADQVGLVVPQLNELVVFPAQSGNGFVVSMTIDYEGDAAPTKQQVEQDMNRLFPAVYRSGQPVVDTEAWFSYNGQIMAGAEMGRSAYQHLSTTTGTGQGSLATELQHTRMVDSEGADAAWMEVDSGLASVPAGGSGT